MPPSFSGGTWSTQSSGTTNDLRGVSCPSSTTCYAVGITGTIVGTVNGGSTWSLQTSGTTTNLTSIACPSSSTCVAVGDNGAIVGTTNSGATWSAQTSATTNNLRGVACPSTAICYAVGYSGTIRGTINGGGVWSVQTAGTTFNLKGVSCGSAVACEAVGDAGVIVGTATRGSSWLVQVALTVYFVGLDGHGSVVTLSDRNGAVQNSHRYDPYGTSLGKREAATFANPWQYAGGFYEGESGLYLLGARYYDPALGRFLQQDPLGSGTSQYSYAGSNPCNNNDPSGMLTCYHYNTAADAQSVAEQYYSREDYYRSAATLQAGIAFGLDLVALAGLVVPIAGEAGGYVLAAGSVALGGSALIDEHIADGLEAQGRKYASFTNGYYNSYSPQSVGLSAGTCWIGDSTAPKSGIPVYNG